MFRVAITLVVCSVLIGIAGCGFQLQGALQTPIEMERTYIATDDKLSPFFRELGKKLQASGVDLVNAASEATAILSITYEETDQRVLSVSARNVPTEYEVFYTVAYDLASTKESMLSTQTITLTRDYTYDATLVLGKAREEEELRKAIVEDLVRVVLKQISTL